MDSKTYYLGSANTKDGIRIGVLASGRGIRRVYFGERSADVEGRLIMMEQKRFGSEFTISTRDIPEFVGVALSQLLGYLKGNVRRFTVPLALEGYSAFLRKVWSATMTIPYGEVRTYKWLAEMTSNPKAVRAVGQAMRLNPIPLIIPCHRVVRQDGSPGGYAMGVEWKIKLLELEGVKVENNKVKIHQAV
ncbi:methylated-DNA--[protein]-cysteine S-methyltransferase [Candidatus Sumerlaeota bacterium]|nr:methylated-DNA--[protein]-cysteine S-methyltransferase [Candidatus Sumerlaeota bacterium]